LGLPFFDGTLNDYGLEDVSIEHVSHAVGVSHYSCRSLIVVEQCKLTKSGTLLNNFVNNDFLVKLWITWLGIPLVNKNPDIAIAKHVVCGSNITVLNNDLAFLKLLRLHGSRKALQLFLVKILGQE